MGIVGVGLFTMTTKMGEEYGVSISDDNTNFYSSSMNRTSMEANKIEDKLENIKPDSTITDRLGAFFSAGYDSILLIGGTLGIFGDVINNAGSKMIGIPSYITGSIIAIMVIIIFVGIILSALLKGEF